MSAGRAASPIDRPEALPASAGAPEEPHPIGATRSRRSATRCCDALIPEALSGPPAGNEGLKGVGRRRDRALHGERSRAVLCCCVCRCGSFETVLTWSCASSMGWDLAAFPWRAHDSRLLHDVTWEKRDERHPPSRPRTRRPPAHSHTRPPANSRSPARSLSPARPPAHSRSPARSPARSRPPDPPARPPGNHPPRSPARPPAPANLPTHPPTHAPARLPARPPVSDASLRVTDVGKESGDAYALPLSGICWRIPNPTVLKSIPAQSGRLMGCISVGGGHGSCPPRHRGVGGAPA